MFKSKKLKIAMATLFTSAIILGTVLSVNAAVINHGRYKFEITRYWDYTIGLTQHYDREAFIFRFDGYPTINQTSSSNVPSSQANVKARITGSRNGIQYASVYVNRQFNSNSPVGPTYNLGTMPLNYVGGARFISNDNYIRTYFNLTQLV